MQIKPKVSNVSCNATFSFADYKRVKVEQAKDTALMWMCSDSEYNALTFATRKSIRCKHLLLFILTDCTFKYAYST